MIPASAWGSLPYSSIFSLFSSSSLFSFISLMSRMVSLTNNSNRLNPSAVMILSFWHQLPSLYMDRKDFRGSKWNSPRMPHGPLHRNIESVLCFSLILSMTPSLTCAEVFMLWNIRDVWPWTITSIAISPSSFCFSECTMVSWCRSPLLFLQWFWCFVESCKAQSVPHCVALHCLPGMNVFRNLPAPAGVAVYFLYKILRLVPSSICGPGPILYWSAAEE